MVKTREFHMSKSVLPLWVIRETEAWNEAGRMGREETLCESQRCSHVCGALSFPKPLGRPAEGEGHHLHLTGEEAEAQRGQAPGPRWHRSL